MEEGMKINTAMMITMRNVIIMKVPDSIQNLIFRNLKEECMLMTSWIGLIPSNVSLSIVIPPSGKRLSWWLSRCARMLLFGEKI